MSTAAQRFAGDVLGKMHGQDQHTGLRRGLVDLANGFEAVHLRHGQVEKNHVGLVFFDVLESLEAVASLMADFNARLSFEQGANAAANDGVIVGDENPIRFGHGTLFGRQFGHHVGSPLRRWEAKPEWWCRHRGR